MVVAVTHASAQQVVEARERVVEAACAFVRWGTYPHASDGASIAREQLLGAVTALIALTVPRDD